MKKKAGDPASEEEGRKPACEEDGTPRQVHPGAHLRRSTALGRLVGNTGHHNSGNRRIVGSGEVYGCDKHPSFKQVAVGILTHKGHLALTINYMQTEKTFFVTFQLRIVPVQRQTSLHP